MGRACCIATLRSIINHRVVLYIIWLHPICGTQEYIEAILALQAKHKKGVQIPLAIMTSMDTHNQTEAFLKDNKYFGAKPSQIHLIKQEKVSLNIFISLKFAGLMFGDPQKKLSQTQYSSFTRPLMSHLQRQIAS